MLSKRLAAVGAVLLILLVCTDSVLAQRGNQGGRGQGGRGQGGQGQGGQGQGGQGQGGRGFRGGRQDPSFESDRELFHFLLDNGDKIQREVKNLDNGIETLTESDDPEVAAKIEAHVASMYERVEEQRPIHMRDPLFRELFQHTEKIEMKIEVTEKGVRVTETSDDPYVAKLLQEHAKVVSLFIKNGRAEAHKNHELPKRDQDQRELAISAKNELFKQLSARLMEVMMKDGPVAAIEVCSNEAADIAKSVSEEQGVKIGRTSFNLRNQNNVGPGWTLELVERRVETPEFVELEDGRLGAFLPIHLKAQCTTCHGAADSIAVDVREKLLELYPHDRAVGFKEGDLRGWFWVEVPADNKRRTDESNR